jgi:MinD-like ATPase involved in chromosome partitioning or flagellar assembly
MERSIKTKQRKVRQLSFTVSADGTTVTGLDKNQVSVADTGTGVKTVTLDDAFAASDYQVLVTVGTADAIANVEISSSSEFVIDTLDATDGTTAKDALVHVLVIGSDILDRY